MAKFLLLSGYGEGLGIALRLKQNGHSVGVWIRDRRSKLSYDGLLQKVGRWESFLDNQTTVLFDSTGGGSTADRLRARGYSVFGGSVFADELENDRALAFELLKKAGVKVPTTKTFYDWDAGRSYAKKFEGRLAFKASGALAKEDGLGTYVASDPQDMVEMLTYYESISHTSPEFELQQVVKGLAVSTEGYFNGETFIAPFNHTLEHKAVLNEDLGPSSGCSINIVFAVENTNHVIEEGLRLMETTLREYEYVGPIDLNTIVNPEGVWALEFTPRFGYDATPTLLELFNADPADLFVKLGKGERVKSMEVATGEYAGGVRVHVPPHPSEEFKHPGGVPIRGLERSDRPHLYFYNVMLDRSDRLVTSPDSYGIVMATTSRAPSVGDAMERAYALADKAKIPEKQYRTDGVSVMLKDYKEFVTLVGEKHNILPEVGGKKG